MAVATLSCWLVSDPCAVITVLRPLLRPFIRADRERVLLELVAHLVTVRLVRTEEPLVVARPMQTRCGKNITSKAKTSNKKEGGEAVSASMDMTPAGTPFHLGDMRSDVNADTHRVQRWCGRDCAFLRGVAASKKCAKTHQQCCAWLCEAKRGSTGVVSSLMDVADMFKIL